MTDPLRRRDLRTAAREARARFATLFHAGHEIPTAAQARRRIRSRPGFFASMSPETLEWIRRYDGPELLGPPRAGGAGAPGR